MFLGDNLYTMFDVKLAMCLPFVDKLPLGVFICCPDTFEPFTFGKFCLAALECNETHTVRQLHCLESERRHIVIV